MGELEGEADLGDQNKFYYNEELKCWVEKGKEDELRMKLTEKAKPPPMAIATAPGGGKSSILLPDPLLIPLSPLIVC